jgi:hypothetical protein
MLDHSTLPSVSETEPKENTVSFQKVLNWQKVEEATNAGVSQSQINEILQQTVSKRRKNLADMRFNLNQFTRFAKELNRALLETQYPPEVKILVTDTRSGTCDISVESTKFGIGKNIFFSLLLILSSPHPHHEKHERYSKGIRFREFRNIKVSIQRSCTGWPLLRQTNS